MIVPSGEKLHFIQGKTDKAGKATACPSQAEGCRLPAYLVAGNEVLVSSANEDFACAHFGAKPGKMTAGLVPTKGLKFDTSGEIDGNFALDAPGGLGTWSAGTSTITIKRGGDGFVLLAGDATRGPPSYNLGEIAGPAYLSSEGKSRAGYTDAHYAGGTSADAKPEVQEDACRVRLRRFGPFLVVDDNDRCGGYGVTFSGLYVKG